MKILILAENDWSGAGHALYRALNAHGHEARAVVMREWYYKFPTDLVNPNLATLRELLDWADVWNVHDEAHKLIPLDVARKPTVITYHGSWYRKYHKEWNALAQERGYVQTCLTQDLSRFGPMWIGRPQDDLSHLWQHGDAFRVAHAPTNREAKGTQEIITALSGMEGIEFDLIEGLPNGECLARKAQASVFVDQTGPRAIGYGTNVLESWAMGMPVISGAPAEIERLIESTVGFLPYAPANNAKEIVTWVERMRDEENTYGLWAKWGRRCLKEHHAPAVVAKRFASLCEKAIDGFKKSPHAGPLVSVCMIVKNEEALLEQAVRSTVGLANEIIIVDTGSEDGTVDLAKRLGASVLTGGDAMHKAQTRNRGIEAARGKWVLILDADEEVADPVGLRKFLETCEATALYVQIDNKSHKYASMRIWLRDAYRYKYRAHEVPIPVNGWGNIQYTDFAWKHNQPADRWPFKLQYTLERLKLDVEENPNDSRPIYYLGRQHVYLEQWELGLEYLGRYLEMSPDGIDVGEAHKHRARCYEQLGDKRRQMQELHLALAALPSSRSTWCELAERYYNQSQFGVALALFTGAMEIADAKNGYRSQRWSGPDLYDFTARCLWHLKDFTKGREYAQVALSLAPTDERLKKNLEWFEKALA